MIKTALGFLLNIAGCFGSLFDNFLCISLCEEGSCIVNSQSTCHFLFIFVCIIFIICGYALITMKKSEKKKIKKKIKHIFH
jgi:hypothetical protein